MRPKTWNDDLKKINHVKCRAKDKFAQNVHLWEADT